MTNRKGVGRPNQATYVSSYGETIHGAYRGSKNQLIPIGRSSPAFALTDEARAIHKFRLWQSQQGKPNKPKIAVTIPSTPEAFDLAFKQPDGSLGRGILDGEMDVGFSKGRGSLYTDVESLKRQERDRLRFLILTDPKKASLELDIPHLADYPAKPEQPQFRLIELAEYYATKKTNRKTGKPTHPKWRENVVLVWGPTKNDPKVKDKRKIKKRANMPKTAFLDVVKVPYVRDIRQSHISAYRDAVLQEFSEHDRSPSWVKTRFRAVKAILSFTQENAEENEKPEYQRVIDLCKILREPSDQSDPSPIDPKHVRALVKAAKPREKAVMLLGLNCLMHSGEATATLKSDIDFEKQTLQTRRTKTGEPRIAKLWDRTVEAIREYQRQSPQQSENLFVTEDGTPMSGELLRTAVVALRRELGLPEHVTFEGVRDAGFQFVEEMDSVRAMWIAGQKCGQRDAYILRQADSPRIRACCKALEKHFFGS